MTLIEFSNGEWRLVRRPNLPLAKQPRKALSTIRGKTTMRWIRYIVVGWRLRFDGSMTGEYCARSNRRDGLPGGKGRMSTNKDIPTSPQRGHGP
jgi:hypothetical protein